MNKHLGEQDRRRLLAKIRPGSAAARVIAAFKKLPTWPRDRTFISKLREQDKSLYDSAYNSFRPEAQSLGMGRIQAALWLAGIVVPAGMTRNTSLAEDLETFRDAVERLGTLSEKSLPNDVATLFRRLKKRAGREVSAVEGVRVAGSMKAVAYLLWRANKGFDPGRLFDVLPPGLYTDLPRLTGPQWYWSGKGGASRAEFVDLIRKMHRAGVQAHQFLPEPFGKLSSGAKTFMSRVNSEAHRAGAKWNWGDIVGEALGTSYAADTKGRAGAARINPVKHERSLPRTLAGPPVQHRRLRSGAERLVDGVLAVLVGRVYDGLHAHDVPVRTLVPKYKYRDDVDIVLVNGEDVAVIEIRYGTPDSGYEVRLRRKLRALQAAGIAGVCVDVEKAGEPFVTELNRKLLPALATVGAQPRGSIRAAIEAVGREPQQESKFPSYEEAQRIVRQAGIESMAAYKAEYHDLGLPSNPNLTYKGRGWTNWSDFVGVERRPGRKKGVVYPGDLRRRRDR